MIHDDHEDIIKRGIDNRMDLYRLIFLLVQIVALFFLALKVYWRNNELQVKFLARVKKRLIVINEEQNGNRVSESISQWSQRRSNKEKVEKARKSMKLNLNLQ